MKFAIIAAGEGSRLTHEGVALPKPLVQLNGEAMIDRLIRIFAGNGASEVVVIVNRLTNMVEDHLRSGSYPVPLRVVAQTTPSSMHSFYAISRYLKDGKFCLTTVDTIFKEADFSRYISAFKQFDGDGLMAVTGFVDDEKPLYVATDEHLGITGFHDANADGLCQYVSGGIYCLSPGAISTLEHCIETGQARMRNFQRQLITDGLRLKAYPFAKIVDVDHAEDIQKAEQFINGL